MTGFSAGMSAWLPYVVGAVVGICLSLLWAQLSRSRSRALPVHWGVKAKPIVNSRECLYYSLLRQTFPSLQVLMKVMLPQFLNVAAEKGAQAVNYRLRDLSVTYLLCTREGRALAAIDVLDAKQSNPVQGAVKRVALEAAEIRYIELPAEPIATAEVLQLLVQGDQFDRGATASDFSRIMSRASTGGFASSLQSFQSTRDQLARTVESQRSVHTKRPRLN